MLGNTGEIAPQTVEQFVLKQENISDCFIPNILTKLRTIEKYLIFLGCLVASIPFLKQY